ncbi:hypothetical protein STEG23_019232, partial [Scotinomys teguina]
ERKIDMGNIYLKQAFLSTNQEEWIRKMLYIYTMEYYTAEKNNDIMKFAGKWMELENVILREILTRDTFVLIEPHFSTQYFYSFRIFDEGKRQMVSGHVYVSVCRTLQMKGSLSKELLLHGCLHLKAFIETFASDKAPRNKVVIGSILGLWAIHPLVPGLPGSVRKEKEREENLKTLKRLPNAGKSNKDSLTPVSSLPPFKPPPLNPQGNRRQRSSDTMNS